MTRSRRTSRAAAAAAVAAGLLVSACSGGADTRREADPVTTKAAPTPDLLPADLSAPDLLARARAAFDGTSMRLEGSTTIRGSTAIVEARRDRTGTCAGTLTYDGTFTRFVSTADASYFKAPSSYWEAAVRSGNGARFAEILDGRWAKFLVDDAVLGVCDLEDELTAHERLLDDIEVGWITPYDDRRAAVLVAKEGTRTVLQLYVDVEAPHRLLGFEDRTSGGFGSLDYSGFGEVGRIAIPGARETLDLPGGSRAT